MAFHDLDKQEIWIVSHLDNAEDIEQFAFKDTAIDFYLRLNRLINPLKQVILF